MLIQSLTPNTNFYAYPVKKKYLIKVFKRKYFILLFFNGGVY